MCVEVDKDTVLLEDYSDYNLSSVSFKRIL